MSKDTMNLSPPQITQLRRLVEARDRWIRIDDRSGSSLVRKGMAERRQDPCFPSHGVTVVYRATVAGIRALHDHDQRGRL